MNLRYGTSARSMGLFFLILVFDPLRCCAPVTDSAAAEFPPAIMITEGKTAGGFPYLFGGISADERERMTEMGKGYNVKMVFAEKSGPFIAGVRLIIEGGKGVKILDVTTDGPWFLIQLPPGSYSVKATFGGKTKEVKGLTVVKDKKIQQSFAWDLGEKGG